MAYKNTSMPLDQNGASIPALRPIKCIATAATASTLAAAIEVPAGAAVVLIKTTEDVYYDLGEQSTISVDNTSLKRLASDNHFIGLKDTDKYIRFLGGAADATIDLEFA